MKKYIIRQVRSSIGVSPKQKLYLKSLGLRRINSVIEVEITPSSTALVTKLLHLIEVKQA